LTGLKKPSNIKKISSVEMELFHVDERTEVTKLIVALGNFAKARKNTVIAGQ